MDEEAYLNFRLIFCQIFLLAFFNDQILCQRPNTLLLPYSWVLGVNIVIWGGLTSSGDINKSRDEVWSGVKCVSRYDISNPRHLLLSLVALFSFSLRTVCVMHESSSASPWSNSGISYLLQMRRCRLISSVHDHSLVYEAQSVGSPRRTRFKYQAFYSQLCTINCYPLNSYPGI